MFCVHFCREMKWQLTVKEMEIERQEQKFYLWHSVFLIYLAYFLVFPDFRAHWAGNKRDDYGHHQFTIDEMILCVLHIYILTNYVSKSNQIGS